MIIIITIIIMIITISYYHLDTSDAATVPELPVPEKNTPLCEPSPCNPSAETAIQPLIWCSESLYAELYFSLEECFFK